MADPEVNSAVSTADISAVGLADPEISSPVSDADRRAVASGVSRLAACICAEMETRAAARIKPAPMKPCWPRVSPMSTAAKTAPQTGSRA